VPPALIVRSANRVPPPRWVDREEHPARSATDHVHLFAHHDPLACSELMINFAAPELL
jgi:hypothetical protein